MYLHCFISNGQPQNPCVAETKPILKPKYCLLSCYVLHSPKLNRAMVFEDSLSQSAPSSELFRIASSSSSAESHFRELDDAFLQVHLSLSFTVSMIASYCDLVTDFIVFAFRFGLCQIDCFDLESRIGIDVGWICIISYQVKSSILIVMFYVLAIGCLCMPLLYCVSSSNRAEKRRKCFVFS